MNITDEMLLTGMVVIAGRWAQKKGFDVKVGIAVVILILFLSVMPDDIASPMGALILVSALLVYGQSILVGLGLVKSNQTNAGAAVLALNNGNRQVN